MREFWFFSFKWWITVPLWHEFWPMAAAGLHIQDQGRLFRMSSGVCQTIKVSEFFYIIYISCTCKSSFFVVFLGIEEWWLVYKSSIMRDKKNGIRFHFIGQPQYWPPLPFFNQIWITTLSQWWSYQFMCSYADRNWVSNEVQYQSKLKEVYLYETKNGFSRLLIQW